ncbi:MAG: hypothetical protein RIB02_13000 [Vicingaceae bacterium]
MSGKSKGDYPYKLVDFYNHQLKEVKNSILNQANVETLYIDYSDAISAPQKIINKVKGFLPELDLDSTKMSGIVDERLHRVKHK